MMSPCDGRRSNSRDRPSLSASVRRAPSAEAMDCRLSAGLGLGRGNRAQVSSTRAASAGVLDVLGRAPACLTNGVGEGFQIVAEMARSEVRICIEAHNCPAARHNGAFSVINAEVIGVRIDVGRQRAKDGRHIGISEGQGRRRLPGAGRS